MKKEVWVEFSEEANNDYIELQKQVLLEKERAKRIHLICNCLKQ